MRLAQEAGHPGRRAFIAHPTSRCDELVRRQDQPQDPIPNTRFPTLALTLKEATALDENQHV